MKMRFRPSALADHSVPTSGLPFGSTAAIVDARVFESEAVAAEVFQVIERVYGTEEGRACMGDIVSELISRESGGFDMEVTVEPLEVAGADVATRTVMSATVEGFDVAISIDLAGHRDGACTVIATFISFGEVFPEDVADDLMSAATAA